MSRRWKHYTEAAFVGCPTSCRWFYSIYRVELLYLLERSETNRLGLGVFIEHAFLMVVYVQT
jgi:hypothetical protein